MTSSCAAVAKVNASAPHKRVRSRAVAPAKAMLGSRKGLELSKRCALKAVAASASTASRKCVAAVAEDVAEEQMTRPTNTQSVRSMMHIMSAGTLATVMEDGWPLGTYMPYILDANANPVIKLRASAFHTANLNRDNRCSLYLRSDFGARTSLLGRVVPLDDSEESATLKAAFAAKHGSDFGVDALSDDDQYCRLEIERIFYVAGLGAEKTPDTVDVAAYREATPDVISEVAGKLVKWMNTERSDELKRCAEVFAELDDVKSAQLLWVDELGCDLRADLEDSEPHHIRLPFVRAVIDERDARSALTMMGQLAWEVDRNYQPQPVPRDPEPEAEQ